MLSQAGFFRQPEFPETEAGMDKDIFEDKGYITYLIISNLIFWSTAIWLLISCLLKGE